MSEVLTSCTKAKNLPNGTLALFKDTNGLFSLILKDDNCSNTSENSNVICHYNNSYLTIVLNLSPDKAYTTTVFLDKEDIKLLDKFINLKNINIVFYTNSKEIYPIQTVPFYKQ